MFLRTVHCVFNFVSFESTSAERNFKKNEGRKNERELCRATEIIVMKESAKAGGRELP